MPTLFKFILLTLFALILSLSCAEVKPSPAFPRDENTIIEKTIYIDPTFTAEEQLEIAAAGEQWSYATRNKVVFHFLIDPNISKDIEGKFVENRMLRMSAFSSFIQYQDNKSGAHTWGTTTTQNKNDYFLIGVVWERVINMRHFRGIVIHELGHSIGLVHENECRSIMNDSVLWKYDCLSKYDLHQFCSQNGCDENYLNYCNYPEIQYCSY